MENEKELAYQPVGVCSKQMLLRVSDNRIRQVEVIGGCDGNSQGICSLLKGMDVDEAIQRMSGIRCGNKQTSCPDQLANALKQMK